jgi:hypothetical protein
MTIAQRAPRRRGGTERVRAAGAGIAGGSPSKVTGARAMLSTRLVGIMVMHLTIADQRGSGSCLLRQFLDCLIFLPREHSLSRCDSARPVFLYTPPIHTHALIQTSISFFRTMLSFGV